MIVASDETGLAVRRGQVLALVDQARQRIGSDEEASRNSLAQAIALLGGDPPETLRRGGLSPKVRRRIVALVEERLDGALSVEDLADAAHLSASYLGRAFRATFGEPPHAYVTRRRLVRARELMLETPFSLSEIALRCGFADHAHLSRLFRADAGLPPAQWRRLQIERRAGHA